MKRIIMMHTLNWMAGHAKGNEQLKKEVLIKEYKHYIEIQ